MGSKDNSAGGQGESLEITPRESIQSEYSQQNKRINKQSRKQLAAMRQVQGINAENEPNGQPKNNLNLLVPNQDQFSFNTNISGTPNIEIIR